MRRRHPITSFNGWLMSKLIAYLTAREGCTNEATRYTAEGIQAVVQDSLGYRYEINIRTLSRVTNASSEELERYEKT